MRAAIGASQLVDPSTNISALAQRQSSPCSRVNECRCIMRLPMPRTGPLADQLRRRRLPRAAFVGCETPPAQGPRRHTRRSASGGASPLHNAVKCRSKSVRTRRESRKKTTRGGSKACLSGEHALHLVVLALHQRHLRVPRPHAPKLRRRARRAIQHDAAVAEGGLSVRRQLSIKLYFVHLRNLGGAYVVS